MADTKQWSDLTRTQQRAIVVLGALEVVVTARALVDLRRQPAARVRGPKALWAVGCFVQPLGPVAYLTLGRRR